MKDNDSGRRASAEPALLASLPEPVPVSAHSGDGQAQEEDDPIPEHFRFAAGVVNYRSGECRNEQHALTHTYAMMDNGDLWPMCGYGWNRSDGERYSIFRGHPGSEGNCKVCARNVRLGKSPVIDGFPHKTRWL